jgi:hypothetical protein
MDYLFGSDRPLLYNVEPWNELGFAVPNWAQVVGTRSQSIWGLADEIGRSQLYVMTHEDAGRLQPPSVNTVMRLGKICNRVRAVLAGRQKLDHEPRVEGGHDTADLIPWQVHPVPYFNSAVVRNRWMKEYNRLAMVALTNMYQHSDNNLSLTITQKFAQDIWVYFNEIKILLGTELLGLSAAEVEPTEFVFEDRHFLGEGGSGGYNPASFTLNMERLDTPGPIQSTPTEVDLRPLFEGIPATNLIDLVAQYSVGSGGQGFSGAALPGAAAAPGTVDGENVAPAGPSIGSPQV